MDKGQEIITTNMDDHQAVEDEISQNLNLKDKFFKSLCVEEEGRV